jgi:hypothetical protein
MGTFHKMSAKYMPLYVAGYILPTVKERTHSCAMTRQARKVASRKLSPFVPKLIASAWSVSTAV